MLVPVAGAPAAITVCPCRATGWASTPWKVCPTWLDFALIVSVVRTESSVPAGRTTDERGEGFIAADVSAGDGAISGFASSTAVGAGAGAGGVFSARLDFLASLYDGFPRICLVS